MLQCYTHVNSGNTDHFFSVDRLGKQPCRGYGMTLRMPNTPKSDAWYPMLENDPNFTISFGVDGTGTASTLSSHTFSKRSTTVRYVSYCCCPTRERVRS